MDLSRTILLGYATAILGVIGFTVSGAAMQALNGIIPDLELTMFRYVCLLTVALLWLKKKDIPLNVPVFSYFHLIITSLASGGFCLFYYAAMNYLPLAHVSATFMCLRTVIMAVLVKILNGKINKMIIISSVGSLVGILLVVQPWDELKRRSILPEEQNSTEEFPYKNNLSFKALGNPKAIESDLFGYFISFIAALCDACFMTSIGFYLKTVNPMVICFFSSLICVPISGLFCFYVSQPVIVIEQSTILLVCLLLASSSLAVVMQIVSCQLIEPVYVSLIENLETVTFLIPQYLIMKNTFHGHMNVMEIGGCFVIVVTLAGTALLSLTGSHEDFS